MLAIVVPHHDDCYVRLPGEFGGLLHRQGDDTRRVLPAKAYLGTDQSKRGSRSLLRPIGGILNPQRMALTGNQMPRHRLDAQSEAWVVDEQLTVQEEAGCPQVG